MRTHPVIATWEGTTRSTSRSTKCPVAVQTGSAAKPDVGGAPAMIGSSTVRSERGSDPTPTARSAPSIAASSRATAPPLESAARNRAAIVATHSSSASFSPM